MTDAKHCIASLTLRWKIWWGSCITQEDTVMEILCQEFCAINCQWEYRQPPASILALEDCVFVIAGQSGGNQSHCLLVLHTVAKFEFRFDFSDNFR
jgi:hypothetical protein